MNAVSYGVLPAGTNVSVFVADKSGTAMPQWLATVGMLVSLHGVWIVPEGSCSSMEGQWLANYVKQLEDEDYFVRNDWYDASPNTNHTCCKLQTHEYCKHSNNTREDYFKLVEGWRSLDLDYYPEQCRYDKRTKFNVIGWAKTSDGLRTGCKSKEPYMLAGEPVSVPFKLPKEKTRIKRNVVYTLSGKSVVVGNATHEMITFSNREIGFIGIGCGAIMILGFLGMMLGAWWRRCKYDSVEKQCCCGWCCGQRDQSGSVIPYVTSTE